MVTGTGSSRMLRRGPSVHRRSRLRSYSPTVSRVRPSTYTQIQESGWITCAHLRTHGCSGRPKLNPGTMEPHHSNAAALQLAPTRTPDVITRSCWLRVELVSLSFVVPIATVRRPNYGSPPLRSRCLCSCLRLAVVTATLQGTLTGSKVPGTT